MARRNGGSYRVENPIPHVSVPGKSRIRHAEWLENLLERNGLVPKGVSIPTMQTPWHTYEGLSDLTMYDLVHAFLVAQHKMLPRGFLHQPPKRSTDHAETANKRQHHLAIYNVGGAFLVDISYVALSHILVNCKLTEVSGQLGPEF